MPHNLSIEATAAALNQLVVTQERQIQQQLRVGLEFERDLPFVQANNTYMATNATISNMLQPFQGAFTPNNTETWDSVENKLEHGKVDLEFDIIQLEETYDTLLADFFQLDRDPSLWDYAQLVINELVLNKLMEEINTASWAGVRVDPTPGTAGTPNQAWNGYGKVIADAITDGNITPITTGALVANTMEAQVRGFCEDLPAAYRHRPGNIYMSATHAIKYAEDYRDKHQRNIEIITV